MSRPKKIVTPNEDGTEAKEKQTSAVSIDAESRALIDKINALQMIPAPSSYVVRAALAHFAESMGVKK